jgi:hypothetical protein
MASCRRRRRSLAGMIPPMWIRCRKRAAPERRDARSNWHGDIMFRTPRSKVGFLLEQPPVAGLRRRQIHGGAAAHGGDRVEGQHGNHERARRIHRRWRLCPKITTSDDGDQITNPPRDHLVGKNQNLDRTTGAVRHFATPANKLKNVD